MDGFALTLKNDKELVRALLALPDAVFRRLLTAAMTRAAKPVIAAARERVAVETGGLKKSLGAKIKKYPRKGIITAIIGARDLSYPKPAGDGHANKARRPALYAHLVELGHRVVQAHSLATYRNKYGLLRSRKGTGATLGRVQARPFLDPALQSHQFTVVAALKAALARGLEREMRRLVQAGG
jgi:hypothetical protein